jgi:hypothetical protein
MPIRGVDSWHVNILCVPEVEERPGHHGYGRMWIACVTASIQRKDGQEFPKGSYYYQFHDLKWEELSSSRFEDTQAAESRFKASLQSLPPELRLFCLLKTEANFGRKLTWASIHTALNHAVQRGFLDQDGMDKYLACVESQVLNQAINDGTAADFRSGISQKEKIRELCDKLVLAPRSVMAVMSEVGIFKVSSVWADFMQQDIESSY